jgi:hypothetical protein
LLGGDRCAAIALLRRRRHTVPRDGVEQIGVVERAQAIAAITYRPRPVDCVLEVG